MPRAAPIEQPALPGLEQTLYSQTNGSLEWFAAALPGAVVKRKNDLVQKLLRALTDTAEVQRLLSTLSADQRGALADVVHRLDGRYDDDMIEARYPDLEPPQQPSGYYYYFGSGERKRVAGAFDIFFYSTWPHGKFIPPDLAALLRSLLPPPPPTELKTLDHKPTVLRKGRMQIDVFSTDAERAVFHDLAATLDMIQQGKVAVGAASRLPTLTTVRQLRERLLLPDYLPDPKYVKAEDAIRPLALVMIAQAAKWAAPTTAGTRLELTKAGRALIGLPLNEKHVREAWERWVKTDLLDELSRVRGIKGQQSKNVHLTKPAQRREKVAAALGVCPTDRWVETAELLRYMLAERLSPEIERGEERVLRTGGSGWGYDYDSWEFRGGDYGDAVVGSYVRVLIWEYAATLGLVEIVYTRPEDAPIDLLADDDDAEYLSRYDGLLGFRLTRLGAYALGLSTEYTPPAPEQREPVLRLLPNLDIVIIDPKRVMPNDRAFLQRIATQQSEHVYRLNRDALLDAVETGLFVQAATEFLAVRSGVAAADFPQTVRVFFSDIERRLDALRESGRMLVVESADPFLLTELANEPGLRDAAELARIGDRTVLLVPEAAEAAARRQLKKLGYIPRRF